MRSDFVFDGNAARKLEKPIHTYKKPHSEKKSSKAKGLQRKNRMSAVLVMLTVFAVVLLMVYRLVVSYDLHSEIKAQTAELNKITMENEQTTLEIEKMTDTARVEEYVTSNLGMQKIESRQVVYVHPKNTDEMHNVKKSAAGKMNTGFVGVLTTAMEYLR